MDHATTSLAPDVRRRHRLAIGIIVFLHLLPAAARPKLIGGDEPHYALMTHSIVTDRDLNLEDDYAEVKSGGVAAGAGRAGQDLDHHTREVNGRSVPIHPVGIAMLAAPLITLQHALFPGGAPDYPLIALTVCVSWIGFLAMFSLAKEQLGVHDGLLVAFTIYYCTPIWFYSRVFMTESYIATAVVTSFWYLQRNRFFAAGLLAGVAFWFKETSLLLVIPLAFHAVLSDRRRASRFLLALSLSAAAWLLKNRLLYGSLLVTFQPFQYGDVLEGLTGLMIDPRNGLLIFAPVVLVAGVGWLHSSWSSQSPLAASLVGFLLYLLLVASWTDWRGGSGYGPRLLVPAIPLAAVPLCSLLGRYEDSHVLRVLIVGAGSLGFAVNGIAATHPWSVFWNPDVISSIQERPLQYAVAGILGVLACTQLPRLVSSGRGGDRSSDPASA